MRLLPLSLNLELFAAPAVELTAKPLEQRRWPLLKPVDARYMKSVGKPAVDLTPELLQTLAAVYDPAIDAAPLKFDHVAKGPAEGWVRRVIWDRGLLWIEPIVFEALEEGIREGKWGRLSAEIHPHHPETKTPYLSGVAVLGAASPAIKSLPFKEAGDRPPLIHLAAGPAATMEDPPVSDPQIPTPSPSASRASDSGQKPADAPAQAGAAGTLGDSTAQALALELRLEQLTRQIETQASRLNTLNQQNVSLSVGNRLDALADRLPFAFRRTLEPVLVHLEADPTPRLLELAQGDKTVETSATEAIFLALEQLPLRHGDLSQEVADRDDPNAPRAADTRTPAQRKIDLRLGISDDEHLELGQKYFSSFMEEN